MCHRDKIDHNDLIVEFNDSPGQLPINMVDLRPKCPVVYDQENLGANAVNAVAMLFHYHNNFLPSRLFMYYNARVQEATVSQDAGSSIRSVLHGLRIYGACPEINYPYLDIQLTYQPSKRNYLMASDHKTPDHTLYTRIPQDLRQIKQCLVEEHPFVFGLAVYESFMRTTSTGLIPMPKEGEKKLGEHAMVCLGFDEKRKVFIVRNSWGATWGDQGHCYLPYEYMTDYRYVYDLWAFYEHKIPQITKVTYGGEVTTQFVTHFKCGQTSINVSNQTFGDPTPGTIKKLVVEFANGAILEYMEDTVVYFNELQTTPCDFKYITKVLYGNECGHCNVTEVFKKYFRDGQQTSVLITPQVFGDPVPGPGQQQQNKKMVIIYQNGARLIFDEGQTLTPANFLSTGRLLRMTDIHLVLYGKDDKNIDVTQIIRNHFSRGQVELPINNQLFGDPYPNVRKELQIDAYNEKTKILPENSILRLSDLDGRTRSISTLV